MHRSTLIYQKGRLWRCVKHEVLERAGFQHISITQQCQSCDYRVQLHKIYRRANIVSCMFLECTRYPYWNSKNSDISANDQGTGGSKKAKKQKSKQTKKTKKTKDREPMTPPPDRLSIFGFFGFFVFFAFLLFCFFATRGPLAISWNITVFATSTGIVCISSTCRAQGHSIIHPKTAFRVPYHASLCLFYWLYDALTMSCHTMCPIIRILSWRLWWDCVSHYVSYENHENPDG